MSSVDKEKIDELLGKLRGLADRAKSTRTQLGSPLVDRALERLNRISAKLPSGNGDSRPQPPEIPRRTCPKCGQSFAEDIAFCSSCGFDFKAEQRRQQRAEEETRRLERGSRTSVIS